MRICVFGVGSIGSLIAARMTISGADVHVYDREFRLSQLRSGGMNFVSETGESHNLPNVQIWDANSRDLKFDAVILAIKAHDIPDALGSLCPLIGDSTSLVTVQNGIPWWYFQRYTGKYANTVLRTVDPIGSLFSSIDPMQIIGCVAYPAAEMCSDGSVRHVEGLRFAFGELDGSTTDRITSVSDVFQHSGFKPLIIKDIRDEIWLKALGNLSFNPVSALTRMSMKDIFDHEPSREVVELMMSEAEMVASNLGVKLRVSIERRLRGAGNVGHHKTSMLQDVEAGRELEVDGLLGSVLEIAKMTDVKTPTLEIVYKLTKALNVRTANPES